MMPFLVKNETQLRGHETGCFSDWLLLASWLTVQSEESGGRRVINLDMLVLAYLSSKVTLLASVVSVYFLKIIISKYSILSLGNFSAN